VPSTGPANPRSVRALWLAVCLVVCGAAVYGCSGLSSAERATIDAWLLCRECSDHELDSVRALGARERSATIDALSADLLTGPSLTHRNHIRQQLIRTHAAITSWASSHGVAVPMTQTDYVAMYLSNFVAVSKIRAAYALGRPGGLDTKHPLDSAAAVPVDTNGFRADVLKAVKYVRDSVWTP
jgi:hypothetical protein